MADSLSTVVVPARLSAPLITLDPNAAPFLSFYMPTCHRPIGRERAIASVRGQSYPKQIEHVAVIDHVGVGIAGVYRQIPRYVDALNGVYVHVLADDDWLAGPNVVEEVRTRVILEGWPDVLVVSVAKQHPQGWLRLPLDSEGPPVEGRIDLGCLVVRRDVWVAHAHDWGKRYAGDYDFAAALWKAGRRFVYATDILFLYGGVSEGRAE